MDTQVNNLINEVTSQQGVIGALIVDKNGLCLAAKGKAASHASGFITSVATRAAQLSPQGKHEVPTVCIETEANNIFIKQHEDITLAVYRLP